MRKHFLILMLLALLPLAGWSADNLTGLVEVAVADTEYGQESHSIAGGDIRVTLDGGEISSTYWDIDGYYEKNDGTGDKLTLATLPVGVTRYVKINFKGAYSGYAYGSFKVNPATITVKVATDADFTMTYLGAKPEFTMDNVTVYRGDASVAANAVTAADYLNITLTSANKINYSFTGEDVNSVGYDVTINGFVLKDADNFTLVKEPRKMKVTPKAIALEGSNFSFTQTGYNTTTQFTYNGLAAGQTPNFAIKWDHDANNTTAQKDVTFTYKYYDASNIEYTSAPVNAGTYSVKVFGTGNYSTDEEGLTVPAFAFTIKQAPLTIRPISQSKVYGETPTLDLATAQWSISGLLGDDQSKTVEGLRATGNLQTSVGDYVVTPAYAGTNINFTSYSAQTEGTEWGAGIINLLSINDEYAIVVVKENSVAGFVGKTYKIAVTGAGRKQLYDGANYDHATGIWVAATLPGEYNVAASIGGVELAKNYAITLQTRTWYVTARPLTITVADKEATVGDTSLPSLTGEKVTPSTFDATAKTGALASEVNAIKDAYTVSYDTRAAQGTEGAENYVPAGPLYGKTITDNNVDWLESPTTYENAIYAAVNDNTVLSNYEIRYECGDLIVNGKGFTIVPEVPHTIEYGDDIDLGFYAYDDNGEVAVSASAVKFIIKKGTEIVYDESNSEKNVKPTDRGLYTVEIIKNDEAMATGAHQGGAVERLTSTFSIVEKHLTLTVKNQTVHKNDPVSILESLTAGENGCTITEELSYNDKLADLGLTYSLDESKVQITNDKIISVKTGQNLNEAILVKISNENYVITGYTKGNLTISTTFTADLAAATAKATIAEAAANGSEYNVTISGRKLNGGVWNALVLPFEITAYEFCEAIGEYAVFNTLTSAKDGNVKFAYSIGTLKANEPFLVKPNKEVDFDKTTTTGTGANAVTTRDFIFKEVEFVNATPTLTIDDASFIGNYETTSLQGGAGIWALNEQTDHTYKFIEVPSTVTINPFNFMGAYLNTNGNSKARILVEEADGSVTAISTINADGVAIAAEGWYTLNGVKLQGAPTEKGVYIQNGKKVVIK